MKKNWLYTCLCVLFCTGMFVSCDSIDNPVPVVPAQPEETTESATAEEEEESEDATAEEEETPQAPTVEDLTLKVSDAVGFGDWGYSAEGSAITVSNWSDGGGWAFATALSQDDYCGIDFAFNATTEVHVTLTITFDGDKTQSIDVPKGSTGIREDFAYAGNIKKIGFKYGDWESTANENGATITITKAVVKAHSTGAVTELAFADLVDDTKDVANKTLTLNRYGSYPNWTFDPVISGDTYEKVVVTFAEPIPDDGIQINAEGETDEWSGTKIAGLTKGAIKATAFLSAKSGKIKSIGFYYGWNDKQGTDDVTKLKIAKVELVKKP